MNNLDIIIPVYRGYDETIKCICTAAKSINNETEQLIVIDDYSPEPELSKWLEENKNKYNFQLFKNPENLGFVKTVNFGMQINKKNDIVLLNSDVEVSGNWIEKLREVAYSQKKVASVTPFSNNATICSFPNFCEVNELPFALSTEELHQHFSSINSENDSISIPTGVGFCRYMTRRAINKIGYFNAELFGKGYGEENDWCQRAEKSGYVNLMATNAFAYHEGGISFAEEQNYRKDQALVKLNKVHPKYEKKVHNFIKNDPIKKYRVRSLWTLASTSKLLKVLHISHGIGGGVDQHINELSHLYKDRAVSFKLAPNIPGKTVSLSILSSHTELKDNIIFDIDNDYSKLLEALTALGISRIHFHHLMGIHPKIWSLPEDLNCKYDFTIHDYYCVNGNPTLIDKNAIFVGDKEIENVDRECLSSYPIPVSAEKWRSNINPLMINAYRLIFPSYDTYHRFNKIFKTNNSLVCWHPDIEKEVYDIKPTNNHPPGNKLKVLVLGALSREKGADKLESVAKKVSNCEFHLLGYAYRKLTKPVITHGPYHHLNAISLIEDIKPDIVWFPCNWPETYSYTLSLALQSRLPIIAPNIGAFPERLINRGYTQVLDWTLSDLELSKFWKILSEEGIESLEKEVSADNNITAIECYSDGFYDKDYLRDINLKDTDPEYFASENIDITSNNMYQTSSKEKVLQILWKIYDFPVLNRLFQLIPFELRRSVKRRLSSKPMHEILSK